MAHLIDKDALVAYIERFACQEYNSFCDKLLDYINSLEVKEVDLEKETKPKFKKGDYIRPVDSNLGAPRTILEVCDGWYVTNQGTLDFEFEDNWEAVEEPVCAFRTNRYTNEDRKVLCDGCEEECEYNHREESVNNGLDLGCGVIWKEEEPVSEDLEKEIEQYCIHHGYLDSFKDCGYTFNEQVGDIARHFANFQKQYMMKDAVNGLVFAQRTNGEVMFRSNYVKKEGFEFGDKVKMILIKED